MTDHQVDASCTHRRSTTAIFPTKLHYFAQLQSALVKLCVLHQPLLLTHGEPALLLQVPNLFEFSPTSKLQTIFFLLIFFNLSPVSSFVIVGANHTRPCRYTTGWSGLRNLIGPARLASLLIIQPWFDGCHSGCKEKTLINILRELPRDRTRQYGTILLKIWSSASASARHFSS